MLDYQYEYQAPYFSGFAKFFFGVSISEIHVKTRRKSGGGDLLFTFIFLLNRGVPYVETMYFTSTEQKK